MQPTVTIQAGVITDAVEMHSVSGSHSIVNLVQQFLDRARAGIRGEELKRRAIFETPFRFVQPGQRLRFVVENAFRQRQNASDAHCPIGFLASQRIWPYGVTGCVIINE